MLSGITAISASKESDASFRAQVLARLGNPTKATFKEIEAKVGITIKLKRLSPKATVVAQYGFNSPSSAIIKLKDSWVDDDVAHELMHCKLELVEGYSLLAWRRDVGNPKPEENAIGIIRSYIDDILVFHRLEDMGFKIDGQVIKSPFFDDICFNVTNYLNQGRPRSNDGMSHLDKVAKGRYGPLRRTAFLIQAEYIKSTWYKKLSEKNKLLLDNFIIAFRTHRILESAKADKVLVLFKKNNIHTVQGHAVILQQWSKIEGIEKFAGLSTYKRKDNGFVLPYPLDIK
jgi:hypothetical protein